MKSMGSASLVRITDRNYHDLLTNEDYSLVIFLTASSSRVGCVLCAEMMPKYAQMATSYYKNLRSSTSFPVEDTQDSEEEKARFVVAYADFGECQEFFQGLEISSVPKIYYYAPGKAVHMASPTDEYRFIGDESAQNFGEWILSHSEKSDASLFKVVETPDYQSMFLTIFAILGFAVAFYRHSDKVFAFIYNKKLWRAACMILSILFCSGYMYNNIRGTEFTGKGKDGEILYFSPSQQSQYGAETQIISVVYAFLAVGVILILDTNRKLTDPKLRFIANLAASVTVYFLYAYLLSCFRVKSGGYPFKLLSFA
ncbi:DEKNAAC104846 [Brettanomyces naardenensis]|uniref:DEKNAAC104846 n=1 Tax=Brettanomyces naardenensis TaxID=13370 RepID=A0A448YSH8_BRENA|nr:DEKNAAC104846 [Brettanomyces naardenensis]